MKNSTKSIEESQLIIRLKEQDISAFNYLYDHYSPALWGLIVRIVKKEEVAQEVLQDVFVKIWSSIGKYTASRGSLFTWMFRLSRNLSIDKLRSREIQREIKTDSVIDSIYAIDRQYNDHQPTDQLGIIELLSSLNQKQQLIIKLIYLQGYTSAEIAKELGIPLGTVKTRHRMAMNHLRKLLIRET